MGVLRNSLTVIIFIFFFVNLPRFGYAQLTGPGFSFEVYDAESIRSTYKIEQLKADIQHAIEQDRVHLKNLQEAALVDTTGRAGMAIGRVVQRLEQRKNDCVANQITDIREQFETRCGIENIIQSCGWAPGGSSFRNSALDIQNTEELDRALNTAIEQGRNTSGVLRANWRSTALNTVEQLNGHLNQVVQANQACAKALSTAQSNSCQNVMDEHLSAQYEQARGALIMNCTPDGIENLMVRLESFMTTNRSPASIVSNNATNHTKHKDKAIELLQGLYKLNRVLKMSGVTPQAKPERQ